MTGRQEQWRLPAECVHLRCIAYQPCARAPLVLRSLGICPVQTRVQNALKNLEEFSTFLRVLGSYPMSA